MFRQALLITALVAWPLTGYTDVSLGERLVERHCVQCHTFEKGGATTPAGPNLYGVIGREAGSLEDFDYSDAFMDALGGRTWTTGLMDQWLTDTQALAPGSAMVYFQDDPRRRSLIIEYLESLSE